MIAAVLFECKSSWQYKTCCVHSRNFAEGKRQLSDRTPVESMQLTDVEYHGLCFTRCIKAASKSYSV
jgi:hypothetical protein